MFRIDEAIQNGDNLFRFNQDNQRMEFAYKDDLYKQNIINYLGYLLS